METITDKNASIVGTHRTDVRSRFDFPLMTEAIYEENRETVVHGLFGWLKR
ncbi:MAG TPA: hypothetical protein VK619_03965 [Pyrinomonadaceae bacterium]|nr:hypothetical protein [Pyrinomonadaceae bacterium]